MKKVLFVGGGSIGHIAPSIAIAQALQRHGHTDCYFVCSTNPNETTFIKKYYFACATIPNPRFRPLYALIQSYRILSAQKPDLVFSKGTSISIPLCIIAYIKGIPIILHESDTVMGRANRFLSVLATHVFFQDGNPVRQEITKGSREKGLHIAGLSGHKPILLVLGGSQGAKALNEIIWKNIEKILKICDVIHITGIGKLKAESWKLKADKGYWSTEFAYDELPHLYAITDVAISRSGANTIAELEANNIPTILVPLRGVGHDHQYQNAALAAKSNPLFTHMEQEKLNNKLMSTIQKLLRTSNKLFDTLSLALHPREREKMEAKEYSEATLKITKVILHHLDRGDGHP